MSVFNAKVTSTEPLSKEEARWIKLSKITYRDPTGTSRTWESAERLTRPKTADIDGVGIVAILPLPTGPELILQKQYRPPINAVTIEVPAGLIDEGETPEECAIREREDGVLAAEPDALDVDVLGEVPDVLGGVDGVVVLGVHDASVVEEDVNAAPGVEGLDHGLDF
ncbi:Uncharacterized protein Y057_13160 [Fusarium fujikuroi]|nr:Uncharacterized protein Y057_13160 [Fusarium fujikuroi]